MVDFTHLLLCASHSSSFLLSRFREYKYHLNLFIHKGGSPHFKDSDNYTLLALVKLSAVTLTWMFKGKKPVQAHTFLAQPCMCRLIGVYSSHPHLIGGDLRCLMQTEDREYLGKKRPLNKEAAAHWIWFKCLTDCSDHVKSGSSRWSLRCFLLELCF